jgi:hypothetical protein
VGQPFASRHEGPGFNPGVYLCETGILLLALSRYKSLFLLLIYKFQRIIITSSSYRWSTFNITGKHLLWYCKKNTWLEEYCIKFMYMYIQNFR